MGPLQALHESDAAFLQRNVIDNFYRKRFEALDSLNLADVLRRKNPYLFKAKNLQTAGALAEAIAGAFLSSQEETIFGNLLEGLAIHVAGRMYGGFKSNRASIDLEFTRSDKYHIVGIKSGTSWGNADQINRMRDNFAAARTALREQGIRQEIVAVNGCMYGRDNQPLKQSENPLKTYLKLAGQRFWSFLTEDEEYYKRIIEPIDKESKKKDAEFVAAYSKKVNHLTEGIILNFVVDDEIDWPRVLEYVSSVRCDFTLR